MKYFLKRFVPVYKASNKICIGFAGESKKYLEVTFSEEVKSQLNKIIQDGIEQNELLLNKLFLKLNELGFLEISPSKNTSKRSDLFLDYITAGKIDIDFKEKKILIFGAGAGGGTLTYLLAQFGFKNIVVVDADDVNESEIEKLLIFDSKDIRSLKVNALQNKIKNNFNINITTYSYFPFTEYELKEIITLEKPNIVVQACDPNLLFRINLNKTCFKLEVPYFIMAYSFEYVKIGPLYIPGFTSCDNSMNTHIQTEYGEHYSFQEHERLFSNSLTHPSISFNINILSSLALKEIIFFLSKQYEYCFSIGRLMYFNPLNLYYTYLNLECDENCIVCKNFTDNQPILL